jgi:hypothetical protein
LKVKYLEFNLHELARYIAESSPRSSLLCACKCEITNRPPDFTFLFWNWIESTFLLMLKSLDFLLDNRVVHDTLFIFICSAASLSSALFQRSDSPSSVRSQFTRLMWTLTFVWKGLWHPVYGYRKPMLLIKKV